MKLTKISLVVLLLAIIMNATLAFADSKGVIYKKITVIEEIKKGATVYTNYFTKNDISTQRYKNVYTYTGLTDPCEKCIIQIRGYRKTDSGSDDASTGRGTIMGLEYTIENSEYLGEWKMSLQRHDATLLSTMTRGEWYLNRSGIEN